MSTSEYKATVQWHRVPGGYLSDQIVQDWPGETTEDGQPRLRSGSTAPRQSKKIWDDNRKPPRWIQHWLMTSRHDGDAFPPWDEEWSFQAWSTLAQVKAEVQANIIKHAVENGAKVTLRWNGVSK